MKFAKGEVAAEGGAKAAAKVERAEMKANWKIDKAVAEPAGTQIKA